MVDIYTEKKESKDWILQNDLYFNLNTSNEEMSSNEINLIQQVDEAKLTPDKHIETKYGFNKSTKSIFWIDSVKSLILSLILGGIILSVIMYYPFFKMYDNELLEEEKANEASEN